MAAVIVDMASFGLARDPTLLGPTGSTRFICPRDEDDVVLAVRNRELGSQSEPKTGGGPPAVRRAECCANNATVNVTRPTPGYWLWMKGKTTTTDDPVVALCC